MADGDYRAELVSVDEFANAHGSRIGFLYRLIPQNAKVMQSASASQSSVGKLAEIVRSIAGRQLESHEMTAQALSVLAGTHCMIRVQRNATRSGKPYMEVTEVCPLKWDTNPKLAKAVTT